MIYLIGKERFIGVKNIILNKIKLLPFTVNLKDFDALIITSKNALRSLKRSQNALNSSILVYALGKESELYAKKMSFSNIKTPPKAYGKDLFQAFKDELRGKKCLYLRAKKIASNLDELLLNEGVNLTQIIAYKNVPKPISQGFKLKHPAVFIFTAPSSVKNFLAHFSLDKNDKCVAIGQSTASALREILGRNFDDKKDLNNKAITQNFSKNLPQIFVPQTQSIKACVELAKTLL